MQAVRFGSNPLLSVDTLPATRGNINGPSIIRTPAWLPQCMGRYYMYFAHHQGHNIRLAHADHLEGPWHLYEPGTLQLAETPCYGHIASPDVHVDDTRRAILMYYHGPVLTPDECAGDPLSRHYPYLGGQRTLLATSRDGIHFTSGRRILGSSYFRHFRWQGTGYALGMPGILYRQMGSAPDDFQAGPCLFNEDCRHFAVHAGHAALQCLFTRAGDTPERILCATVDTRPDWSRWQALAPTEVLRPAEPYEGVDEPLVPSQRGAVHGPARQLRDPCIFAEEGRLFLFYAIAGEQGIAGATLQEA